MAPVSITVRDKVIQLSSLDLVRIVAAHNGLEDVDCEPEVNGYKVTASAPGRSVTARGRTLDEVCERFLDRVIG